MLATIEVIDRKSLEHAVIHAVAFDFDDTIVTLPVSWQSVMADLFVDVLCATAPLAERRRVQASFRAQIEACSGMSLTAFMDWLRTLARHAGHDAPLRTSQYRELFDTQWRSVADDLHRPEHVPAGLKALAAGLSDLGVQLYVVTGGDRQHKLQMLRQLEFDDVFPEQHLFGDEGPSCSAVRFAKRTALAEITASVRARLGNGAGTAHPVVALIGDSEHDMREARAAGAVAVGYRQRNLAHALVTGMAFPSTAEFVRHIRVGAS